MKPEERFMELPAGYAAILADLKDRTRAARLKAGLAVNRELVLLYWRIGRQILEQQRFEGWGSKVIDRLSLDLVREFPEMKGLSSRNLKYMRAFTRHTLMRQLCSSLLHKFPGFITVSCWIKLNALKNASGIFAKISPMAGAGMSWSTRLRAAFMSGGGEPWSTSSGRFLPRSLNWPGRSLKIHTTSIS